ncbi:MAG: Holliday junction branch migration protein RuvA [Patescibacteria group bacterium]
MLSYFRGKIKYLNADFVILDVKGLGYKIFITPKTYNLLKKQKENVEAEFFTHLRLREDVQELYGFLTYPELEFFELIISVQGVGPRAGLQIMSEAPILDIKSALARGDVDFFDKVPGIGRKKAKRFVIELQDKIDLLPEKGEEGEANFDDAVSALKNLGYKENEVRQALRQVPNEIKDIGKKVKYALKILSKK